MIERILIVGYGSIGRRHLKIVRQSLPEGDIRILRHGQSSETPNYANGSFNSLAEALTFRPQVAVIASPSPFHLSSALALIDSGCHLLVEKPLANNLNDTADFINKVHLKKCVLQVGYNLRYLHSLNAYRNRINSGVIGRVLSVRCEVGQFLPTWRPDTDYRGTVSARKELGGGVLLEMSHELDYLRWVFGEVDWVSAWTNQQSTLQIDVEDIAHITIGFAKCQEEAPPVAILSMDFFRHDTARTCIAIGEKGSLRWNGLNGDVDEYLEGGDDWSKIYKNTIHRDDSYKAQWNHFLGCVNNNSQPLVGVQDGIAVLEIIDAIRKSSMEKGSRIFVVNKR